MEKSKVIRSGSFRQASYVAVAFRIYDRLEARRKDTGFRVVKDARKR